jgi:predicted nucleic acid-binding protein
MIVLLDTNVVVDILSERGGYEDSLRILAHCKARRAKAVVSAVTVTNIMYILRKYISPDAVRGAVRSLLAILDVEDILKSDISAAFSSDMKDFEDAVQASCAGRIYADYIVTRDVKDFKDSTVPAISPGEMIKLLED